MKYWDGTPTLLDLPDIPQHVVQRSNNRLSCFLDDEDKNRYLTQLREALRAIGCALHAYVLMDNPVHFLQTSQVEGAIARLMQKLGRQYVAQFNVRHHRTGTFWEGRYKACLVDQVIYLLRCHCYIDLNPMRARITDDATQFLWSSAAAHCGLRSDGFLTSHPIYPALGNDRRSRSDAHQTLLRVTISDDDLQAIRIYLK